MRSRSGSGIGLARVMIVALLAVSGAQAAVFDCDETGLQNALAAGGGPHTFSCAGPTTVTIGATAGIAASVILDGEGELSVSGGNSVRVFSVAPGIAVELRNLTVTAGHVAAGNGGGIYNEGSLSLTNCTISASSAGGGGGVYNNGGTLVVTGGAITSNDASTGGGIWSTGSLTLQGTNVSGNTAGSSGGGVRAGSGNLSVADSTISGNSAFIGGGLFVSGAPGPYTVTRSTLSGNTATDPNTRGGAIRNGAGALSISNSSLAGNSGGAISNVGGVLLQNSTISGNSAGSATAIYHAPSQSGSETLHSTIVDGSCSPAARASQGGNLESPGNSCGLTHASDQVNVSAAALHLGSLGSYGGPTQTVPLLPGSVAIDAAVACPPPGEDQRSVLRPQGAGCDAGAFELVLEVPALPSTGVASLVGALAAIGALALRRRAGRSLDSRA